MRSMFRLAREWKPKPKPFPEGEIAWTQLLPAPPITTSPGAPGFPPASGGTRDKGIFTHIEGPDGFEAYPHALEASRFFAERLRPE
jgi:hypothetical protein